MRQFTNEPKYVVWMGMSFFFVAILACNLSAGNPVVTLKKEPYASCVTPTPIPTEQFEVFVGLSTPNATVIYEVVSGTATPDPTIAFEVASGTSTPDPNAPLNPLGTPVYFIVFTPEEIFETRFTTPVPTATPYYKVEDFHQNDLVHIDGATLQLIEWDKVSPADNDNRVFHTFVFEITNRIEVEPGAVFPLSRLVFIRRIKQDDGTVLNGKWGGEVLGEDQGIELTPLPPNGSKQYQVAVLAPKGEVLELAVSTDWQNNLQGGVPVWFESGAGEVDCPEGWAAYDSGNPPPQPTSRIIGYGGYRVGGGDGTCTQPTQGVLTRGFGCSAFQTGIISNICSGTTKPHFHNGWDIANAIGSPIRSPISGSIRTGYDSVLGNFIFVSGENGERHDLLHLSESYVTNGQQVNGGDVIAEMGSTGNSTGSHLHWTVRIGGQAVDPANWDC